MIETAAMINELEKAFKLANDHWFEGKLPTPMIIVSRKTSKWELGYITTSKVWIEKEFFTEQHDEDEKSEKGEWKTKYEINISAEGLYRPIEEIICTLVHEMVHLYCRENDIKDTSQKIHNKKFKAEAEARDLIVEKGQGVGWGYTRPSEEFISVVSEWGIDESVFNFVRRPTDKPEKEKKKKRAYIYTHPDNEKVHFKCKYDIVVTDQNGVLFDQEVEEGDEDED